MRRVMTLAACLLVAPALAGCDDDSSEPTGEAGGPSGGGGTTGTSAGSTTTEGATSTATTSTVGTTTAGTSGSTGEGGSTTGALPDGQWSITEITYDGPGGSQSVQFMDCTFCDATINGPTLLVRFQQAGGWTVWSLDIPIGSSVGSQPITDDFSGAYVAINEQNPDLLPDLHGFYAPTTGAGTLTLTAADIRPGGVVEGTLDATLSLGGNTAALQSDFRAEIPR